MDDTRQRIDNLVNRGLLDQWYAVAKSVQVKPGKPHAVKALGRNLVLWRDGGGTLKCIEDYCPHRGARLSRGEVLGRQHRLPLSWRHARRHRHDRARAGDAGLSDGRAPSGRELSGRRVERCDLCLFRQRAAREPQPLGLPEEFSDPEWSSILCVSPWSCNYRYALDNLADPMHGSYLHADSFTLAFGAKQDTMKIEKNANGFVVARVGQQGENFDWTEMVTEAAAPYCRLDIPYPAAAGPGGPFRIIGFTTPVDEDNCLVFFWRLRKASGLAREVWRFHVPGNARAAALARAGTGPRDADQPCRPMRASAKCSISMTSASPASVSRWSTRPRPS